MQILMCRDAEVYDIEKNEVIHYNLLPGILQAETSVQNYRGWCQGRYSVKSNVYARIQRATTYPYNRPDEIDQLSGAFSLSDSYWIKTNNKQKFNELSPYYIGNWRNGKSVATIYTNGWQSKRWESPNELFKNASKNEIEIMRLAGLVNLTTVVPQDFEEGILIPNFTDTEIMFEPADMSVAFYADVLEDTPLPRVERVIEVMGSYGELMLIYDDIVGNNDRHLGNFGFLRYTTTGELVNPSSEKPHTAYAPFAPLFDFDQSETRLVLNPQRILRHCRNIPKIKEMCKKIMDNTTNEVYRSNSKKYLECLGFNGNIPSSAVF